MVQLVKSESGEDKVIVSSVRHKAKAKAIFYRFTIEIIVKVCVYFQLYSSPM